MDDNDRTIGRRLREVRYWRRKSLRAVAELAGISEGYLSRLERGERPVDRRSTLEALARALRVTPAELTGAPYPPTDAATSDAHESIAALRVALAETELDDPAANEPARPLAALRTELAQVNTLRQDCDYAALGQALPPLVVDLHAHLDGANDQIRRELLIALVECYEAARAAGKHLGAPDLSQIAARHVRDVADALSGPEWMGLAAWSRAQAIGSTARGRALSLTREAADELSGELDSPAAAEIYGALHLVAALAATTLGRFDDAESHLTEATETAVRTGSGTNFAQLYFGPANVETWRMMLAAERGEGGKVAEIASNVDPACLPPSRERRSAFYVDLGRGLAAERGRRGDAVAALRIAEEIAPQKVRINPLVRETVGDLLYQARRDAEGRELRGLAYRMGVAR